MRLSRGAGRWLLVALLLGLAGMHHLAVTQPDAAGSHSVGCCEVLDHHGSPGTDGPAPADDLLHLCMSVIVATTALLLALRLLRWAGLSFVIRPRPGSASSLRRPAPPPLSLPVRLAFLGVLRH